MIALNGDILKLDLIFLKPKNSSMIIKGVYLEIDYLTFSAKY